ncbi:hypothetical protein [Halorubrum sp. SD626R]|uniref:hypothetical protein n=1 Tax=Halorubrum sp. SD626R TaxID=1419722 RepID=UPI000A4F7AEB|nr:hypothetical protein [Halorubrum sp. SD626R]
MSSEKIDQALGLPIVDFDRHVENRRIIPVSFGVAAVLGIADVNLPAVQSDSVDGVARLNEQIDRVREFLLAAVGESNGLGRDDTTY